MLFAGKEKLNLLKDQLYVLVARDFKVKYNSTALGFVWSLLLPIAEGFLYFYAFSSVARFDIPNYFLYLISGMFMWHFFSSAVTSAKRCFVGNAALIKKTNFDRSLLVISKTLTEFIHFLLTIPALIGFMLMFGVYLNHSVIQIIPILLALFLFTLGGAFIVATLNLYFRDVERIIQVFMQMWFFGSPIFYDLNNIRGGFEHIIRYNPMLYFMIEWRNVFYAPHFGLGWIPLLLLMGTVSFATGYILYRLNEPGFAEKL